MKNMKKKITMKTIQLFQVLFHPKETQPITNQQQIQVKKMYFPNSEPPYLWQLEFPVRDRSPSAIR